MKKATAYLRMSTDKQEYSIESQKRMIKDYAKRYGYNIEKYFIDSGISGRDAEKRPAFMEMIEESKKGSFQYILIYDSSRFARNLEQSLVYKSILKKNNVNLISITEPSLDEDNQLIADALLGAMNEMYSRKLSKVVKRGMMEKALKGEYISCAPYGYFKPQNKPLVVVKDEAKIVKKIFDEFLKGKSAYAIAKNLNENKVKTKKGNNIDTRWVKKILTNPTYKGYYCFNIDGRKIFTKANHIAIIDKKDFDKVQELFKNNLKREKSKKPLEYNKHWLCGLIRCKYCGETYVYAKYYNNRQDRFRCGGYTCGKCDSSFSIGVNDIEELVLNKIKSIYPKDVYKVKIRNNTQNKKDMLIKEKDKYKRALEKSKQAYLMGIDTIEEYKENKKNFVNKIEEIDLNIKHIKSEKDIIKEVSILKVLEEEKEMQLKNKMARLVIRNIEIDGKNRKISIYFNV